jgi:hypothetical protein
MCGFVRHRKTLTHGGKVAIDFSRFSRYFDKTGRAGDLLIFEIQAQKMKNILGDR